MANVIPFYIPTGFQSKAKWVPPDQRGKIIELPNHCRIYRPEIRAHAEREEVCGKREFPTANSQAAYGFGGIASPEE